MPALQLTDEQVMELLKQLPSSQENALFEYLLTRRWPEWASSAEYGAERARQTAAARGRDWDAMTEEEREDFVDELVHEDRPCSGS
jgi:hypothetical protein